MIERYALVGNGSGDLLTFQGRVIAHDNKREMQFLFPNSRVVRLSRGDLGQPWMWLKDHPDMETTRFPLRREDFPGG